MTQTEQRYAQIEKEALAFTCACERLSDYLMGLTFHVQTDHKPLVPLFTTKHLEELPLRVQRFRLRMMRFNFSMSHVPGKDLLIADALSRSPNDESEGTNDLPEETQVFVDAVLAAIPATEERLEQIRQAQKNDAECQKLLAAVQTGWPAKQALPSSLKPYHAVAGEITVANGLLLRGSRIIIPSPLRKEILQRIHDGHLGITKCRERAKQSVWWPRISEELTQLIADCEECCKNQRQRAQPLTPSKLPLLPWQKIGTDLFEWNHKIYLLIIDYYSRYIEVAHLTQATASEIVAHTKSIFARHGIPETVISDNGPQYTSEQYSEFAKSYHFHHVTSSPYYPQSNGEAERAVGTIKALLKKNNDPYLALLAYRPTPLEIGYSPAELLMNRILRSTVPTTREQRQPRIPDRGEVERRDLTLKKRQKYNHDTHHGTRSLPPLTLGDRVWITDRQEEGTVEEERGPESYHVATQGSEYRRNRRHLIRLPATEENVHEQLATSDTQLQPPDETALRRSSRATVPPDWLDLSWTKPNRV